MRPGRPTLPSKILGSAGPRCSLRPDLRTGGGEILRWAVTSDIARQALAGLGRDGLVVNGAVRDLDGLDAAGLPTFASGAHPATGSNQGPALNVVAQCSHESLGE